MTAMDSGPATRFLRDIYLGSPASRVQDDNNRTLLADPMKVYELYRQIQDDSREKLVSIAVSAELKVINFDVVALGAISGVIRQPKYLYWSSVAFAAPGVVVVHNHANGNPTPNDSDEQFHKAILNTYRDLGIEFHDHVIIGDGRCYSFMANKEFSC